MIIVLWEIRDVDKLTHLWKSVIFLTSSAFPKFSVFFPASCFSLCCICSFLRRKCLHRSNGWTMSHRWNRRVFFFFWVMPSKVLIKRVGDALVSGNMSGLFIATQMCSPVPWYTLLPAGNYNLCLGWTKCTSTTWKFSEVHCDAPSCCLLGCWNKATFVHTKVCSLWHTFL